MSTLSFALIIVAIIILTCLAVNAVNQQKEYATTATLGLGAVAVGALAVSNMNSLKSGGVPNMAEAQRRIKEWVGPYKPWDEGALNLSNLDLEVLPELPKGLRILYCHNNNLKSLPDPLPNNLTTLNCSNNKLKTLPQLPIELTTLVCTQNQLRSLPQLPEGLKVLTCNNNEIICLPVLPSSLDSFTVSVSKLQYPPVGIIPDGDPIWSPSGGRLISTQLEIQNIRNWMEKNPERPPECNLTS